MPQGKFSTIIILIFDGENGDLVVELQTPDQKSWVQTLSGHSFVEGGGLVVKYRFLYLGVLGLIPPPFSVHIIVHI